MKAVTVTLALIASYLSYGQASQSLSIGPDFGFPTNTFGDAKTGLGGSLEYNIKITGPLGAQFHIGYQSFTSKSNSSQEVTFLPIRLGLIAFVYQDLIFVSADAGTSHYYSPSTGTKQDGFTFGAGAGYRILINKNQFVQVSGYYNRHHFKKTQPFLQEYNYNWFNLRAAYGLSWGKKIRKE
jgi:hypothetical protein